MESLTNSICVGDNGPSVYKDGGGSVVKANKGAGFYFVVTEEVCMVLISNLPLVLCIYF